MRIATLISAYVLTVALVHAPAPVTAQPRSLLDIPFVPQTEALCGGAAAAMVLRYWKAAPVYAEDFASLVNESAEGISLGDLVHAVRQRGWRALPLAATSADVQGHLQRGRPVIALIEDRPGRNHYVVVVGWTDRRIVFHDPARGPFRVVDGNTFERAWGATGHTALLIVPQQDAGDAPFGLEGETLGRGTLERPAINACQEPLDRAVGLARGGDLDGAEAMLTLIIDSCPTFSGGPRELAGIRFLQRRWADAAVLSAEAVARDKADMHAWQLLASARYLDGDPGGALAAWNSRQEPRIDLARIEGLDRTRYDVVAAAVNLPPHTLLTESDLRRAARRVAALPVVRTSRVGYSPAGRGQATLDVAIVERPLMPNTWPSLTVAGVHAVTAREARLDIASPSGNGELWTLSGRWWANRPRVSLSLATPQPWRSSGVWRVEGTWERQTHHRGPSQNRGTDVPHYVSDRRRAAVTFADWASGDFRWELSGALDHWNQRGHQMSAGAAAERRLFQDRLALRGHGAVWPKLGVAEAFASGALTSAWRSSARPWPAWTAQTGMFAVSAAAPLDLWPAADTGLVRAPMLRAHPLLTNGAIRADGVGRVLLHGTVEFQKPLVVRSLGQIGFALFADAAKLAKAGPASPSPLQIDLGAGLRAQIPGAPGLLRLDIARGMRDGRMALSAAWQTQWPSW